MYLMRVDAHPCKAKQRASDRGITQRACLATELYLWRTLLRCSLACSPLPEERCATAGGEWLWALEEHCLVEHAKEVKLAR